MNLNYFTEKSAYDAGITFFESTLERSLKSVATREISLSKFLKEQIQSGKPLEKVNDTGFFLGTFRDIETNQISSKPIEIEEEIKKEKYEEFIIFLLESKTNQYLNRTEISRITRALNQRAKDKPVILLTLSNSPSGKLLSISTTDRGEYVKKGLSGEKVGKVHLLKDIKIENPHSGHLRILRDLKTAVSEAKTLEDLYKKWKEVFDLKLLNKRFYSDLSNWYFWALQEVHFPTSNLEADDNSLLKKEEKVKEHNAKNLIRLLTRLLFVWFVKEKNLIPDKLFDESYINEKLLNGFEPKKKREIKTQTSVYYKAVLQNLFFATLNQTVGNREFRKEGQHMNVTNLMRYEKFFKDPKLFIDLVEEVVPFMNGGLFECLDRPDPSRRGKNGGDVILYEDGFSDRKDSTLKVPDYIFFETGESADLSEELGDKKQKNVKVTGLINILKSYKFTVTENTPIEEDVALDPELLGRVFENLLASYNPETKTTARKQTGSFYTPREIVDYMVDESLKAYLQQKLETESGMKTEDVQDSLEMLIGYNEKINLFNEKQTEILINAIDKCKILDPACGSGAFPMGILHKLVHVLHKLDPNNKLWKEQQIQKVSAIDDPEIRENMIQEIETAFESNELDYGRKLYLIENCIYGVDIQPIATQISKLRFFISLIVEQKVDRNRENFGIRPLPNLETKFVAANALIGISKPEGSFRDKEVEIEEQKLKDIHHSLFSAKVPARKRDLREKDREIREKLGLKLKKAGWSNESAHQLASWDPFNQNVSTGWFDPEWMFGIQKGFDVVIGNPPYVQLQKDGGKFAKIYEKMGFETYSKEGDIYSLFYEKGFKLLNSFGYLCYITSNKWMRAGYGKNTRKFFAEKARPILLIDFGQDLMIFENAIVHSNILLFTKHNNKNLPKHKLIAVRADSDFNIEDGIGNYVRSRAVMLTNLTENAWVIGDDMILELKKKVEKNGIPLKKWDNKINFGIKTGFNEAFIIDAETRDELINNIKDKGERKRTSEIIKPILRGRDTRKYYCNFADLWIINSHNGIREKSIPAIEVSLNYPSLYNYLNQGKFKPNIEQRSDQGDHWSNLRTCAYLDDFEKPKIIFSEIVSEPQFYYDIKGYYPEATVFIMTGNNLKYLTGILNSWVSCFIFQKFYAGGELVGKIRYKKAFLELLPIPKPTQNQEVLINSLVDKILNLKDSPGSRVNADTSLLEAEIDARVFHLYNLTQEEMTVVLDSFPKMEDKEKNLIRKFYKELG